MHELVNHVPLGKKTFEMQSPVRQTNIQMLHITLIGIY
jgi:hypothetical protein